MKILKMIRHDSELRKNMLVIILILAGIRLFYSVPVPGININYFADILKANSALGFMNVLTGNGLSNMSVMMLNITPFITASIIMQLMGNIFPRLQEMQKGLKTEQKKYENITIVLGIIFAFAESCAIAIGYGANGLFKEFTWYWAVSAIAAWTIGSAAASLLGKHIQEKYTVNGTSLILLLNVISGYLTGAKQVYHTFVKTEDASVSKVIGGISIGIIALILTVALFVFTYVIAESERKIKVVYAGKSTQNGLISTDDLPLKLCPGSVVPIIFASSIMSTPVLIAGAFTGKTDALWARILSSNNWFTPGDWVPTIGFAVYIALIFAFSFYYVDFSMNPKEIADNLKKAGGTIPKVRPGAETAKYIRHQFNGVVFLGAAALSVIAALPIIVSGLFGLNKLAFFGTSVIITVGIFCDLKRHLQARTYYGTYKGKEGLF